jgi:hypothetical protein
VAVVSGNMVTEVTFSRSGLGVTNVQSNWVKGQTSLENTGNWPMTPEEISCEGNFAGCKNFCQHCIQCPQQGKSKMRHNFMFKLSNSELALLASNRAGGKYWNQLWLSGWVFCALFCSDSIFRTDLEDIKSRSGRFFVRLK